MKKIVIVAVLVALVIVVLMVVNRKKQTPEITTAPVISVTVVAPEAPVVEVPAVPEVK